MYIVDSTTKKLALLSFMRSVVASMKSLGTLGSPLSG